MRAAPPVQLRIAPCPLWRAGLGLLAAAAFAAMAVWWARTGGALPLAAWILTGLGSAGLIRTEWRRPPLTLHWDGQCWHVAPHGGGPADSGRAQSSAAHSGGLAPAVDLGAWMLLRFEAERRPAWRHRLWIPLSRGAAGRHWHALRCAVYSDAPPAAALHTHRPSEP